MPPKKGKQRSAVEKKDSSSGEFEHISLASALDSAIQDGGGEAAAANDAVPQPAAEAAAAPVEPGEAAEAAARAAGAAAGEDSQADPMRELEEATARAAEQAMVAARQAAKGLSAAGGWLSGLVKSGLQAVQAEAVPSSPSRAEEAEGLRRQLGLPEGEAVLESFSCQLLQTYEPRNNAFTPTRLVAYPGHLHIASNHICFVATTTIAVVPPMRVAAADLRGLTKEPATFALPARLVLGLAPRLGQTLCFTNFALKELEMDSCQALLQKVLDTPRGQA